MGKRSYYHVQSVDRALALLLTLAGKDSTMTLPELSKSLGLSKSTTYRLICTLEQKRFLESDPSGRGYRLGSELIHLGHRAHRAIRLPEIARPHLQRLSDRFGESTGLTVPHGDQVLYLAHIETERIVNTRVAIGSQLPAYCTSTGKVFLAKMPPEQARRVLAQTPLEPRGPKTITDIERLMRELARVREQGYAINDEELERGDRAIAAAVRSSTGEVIAAINLSAPATRVSMETLTGPMCVALLETAEAISRALGYRPPSSSLGG